MYYYIFEPPQGAKEYERTAQIKETLSTLGIAGEMTSPVPGKSLEDLVDLAVAKRYSTIVAVGDMEHINRVARAVLHHDAVFGIIPTHPHADITALIGVAEWQPAAELLKRRRLQQVQMGSMNEQIAFLTPAIINIPHDQYFEIKTPKFTLQGHDCQITISPIWQEDGAKQPAALGLDIQPLHTEKRGLLQGIFQRKNSTVQESHLQVPSLILSTQEPLPVQVAGEVLTSTPVQCAPQPKPLRLIVGRAQIPLTPQVET